MPDTSQPAPKPPKPKAVKKPTKRGRPRGWKRLSHLVLSWPVISAILAVLYGAGVNATYGHDPTVAAVLYFLAVLLATIKLITWEEARKTRYRGAVTAIVVLFAVVVLAASLKWAFSKRQSIRSHIHIDHFDASPVKVGEPLWVNVDFKNDGQLPLKATSYYLAVLEERPANKSELNKREDDLFHSLEDQIPGFSPSVMEEVPVNSARYFTDIVGGDSPHILTAEELPYMENGQLIMFFMGRITYSDSEGMHHTDYCGLVQRHPVFLCHDHNVEP